MSVAVVEFNPYHDERGRFTTANNAKRRSTLPPRDPSERHVFGQGGGMSFQETLFRRAEDSHGFDGGPDPETENDDWTDERWAAWSKEQEEHEKAFSDWLAAGAPDPQRDFDVAYSDLYEENEPTDAERSALHEYVGGAVTELDGRWVEGYDAINSVARGQQRGPETTVYAKKHIAALDRLAAKAPMPMVRHLYRSQALPGVYEEDLANPGSLHGFRWRDDGFVSTSMDGDYGLTFGPREERLGMMMIDVRAPIGTPAIHSGAVDPREFEAEVILGRGLTFEVTGHYMFTDDTERTFPVFEVDVVEDV